MFRALGRADPPSPVTVGGTEYTLSDALKHDSWAATAVYASASGHKIICKFNRTQPAIISLRWLGRRLARRESQFLKRLAHLDRVPDDLGPVSTGGQILPNAVARAFIAGEAWRSARQVDAPFFAELRELLDRVHATGMAYVDLHKRENIIVDTEGHPHLIDFQVCLGVGDRWPGNGRLTRMLVARLQEMDDYHFRKHHVACLRGAFSPEERRQYVRPPGFISAHRKIAVPLRSLRRWLLTQLKIRDATGRASSEVDPEDSFRPLPASTKPHQENA